jgi:hypothetical protein
MSGISVPSRVINGNLGHSITWTHTKTSISSSINANYSQLQPLNTLYTGPNLNIGQVFAKGKVRATIGSSFNMVFTNSINTNKVLNHRVGLNYSPKLKNEKAGKFTINLSAGYLQKLRSAPAESSFTEFTGNFGINYSF